MEEEEKTGSPETTPTLKEKKKSHGFCSLLNIRKKKVGCLPSSSDVSLEESPGPSKNPSPSHKAVFQLPSPPRLNKSNSEEHSRSESDELKRSDAVAKSCSSTNVALCCAITESSRTPMHFQSDFKMRYNNDLSNVNRRSILTRMNGHSEDLGDRLPPSGLETKLKKPASETNIVATARKAETVRKSFFGKAKKTHKRSFSLGKSSNNEENVKESLVLEASHSASEVSPQSSPSPVEASHARLRRRLLLSQRRSVDNIMASSSAGMSASLPDLGSSPGSTRSIDTKDDSAKGGKKKSRPASVILLGTREDKSREVSMESLVRQSLLAAQVFHLIPTTKARERNFLHGRIAATSLLGAMELERVLPTRELNICVVTWNMNGQAPPSELNSLVLPEGLDHLPDVLAVGTQESFPERFLWEVGIQETLGPSHVLFHSATLGTLHLALYLRRDLLWFCSVPEEDSFSVRPGTAFRTKGAVAVGFSVFGTSLLFITAHLTAHQDKVKERLQDIKRITKSLELPRQLPLKHKSKDVTQNYDCVFWFGDLNFRLTPPREEVMSWINKQKFPLTTPSLGCLADQLTTSIVDGNVFRGFEEGPLTFAPTYKFDPGTQIYDSSHKQRTPSYTDRILFRCRRGNVDSQAAECLAYASVPAVCTSDHKPVWGLYKCIVRPGIDTIPLAAGMFNREVYLEAIKRRAAAMDLRGDTSTICALQ